MNVENQNAQPAASDDSRVEIRDMAVTRNKLFADDCLNVMRTLPTESMDLIYLDPPFNSNVNYNAFFNVSASKKDRAQIDAFNDTWFWNVDAVERVQRISDDISHPAHFIITAFNIFIPDTSMLSYVSYMAERLVEMHRILKPTGAIYLHCDSTSSHFLKLILDGIFKQSNFRNDIIWSYQGTGQPQIHFKRKHDNILFYAKSKDAFFSHKGTSEPISDFSKSKFTKEDAGGRYKDIKHPDGTIHKQYMRNEQRMRDVWGIPVINAMSKERLGWPTQKPLELLTRIVEASSNQGDVVLDPFCGCGTTIDAAYRLKRNFIGIDVSYFALEVVRDHRMKRKHQIPIEGEPKDLKQAIAYLRNNPFLFEKWAVTRTHGLVDNIQKSGDGGIDGRGIVVGIKEKNNMCIVQVKGGVNEPTMCSNATAANIREFIGLLASGEGIVGLFITMIPLSHKRIRQAEANMAKIMKPLMIGDTPYKRLVFHSISEHFEGQEPILPPLRHTPHAQQTQRKLSA